MATETGWERGRKDAITDVAGVRVGHWTDRRGGTGCTVILCPGSSAAAVDVRGGAPGTRETDVLDGANMVRRCDAVVFSGGSAFGLAAADGAMRWCAENGLGYATSARKVPIVSGAVILDFGIGKADIAPGPEAGYLAASRATGGRVAQGSVGAGTGATVAKILGPEACLKGGIGTASAIGPRGIVVGALVVTNAVGQVQDPATGRIIAGPRGANQGEFVSLPEALARRTEKMDALLEQTTLVCVATNAAIDHRDLQRLTFQAHDGLARTINPIHTFGDGDVVFAVAIPLVETKRHDLFSIGAMVVDVVEQAVLNSVRLATGLHGIPSASEWMSY